MKTKLRQIVEDYQDNHLPIVKREIKWFHTQPDFKSALETAASATNSQGIRYDHQHGIKVSAVEEAHKALKKNQEQIMWAIAFDPMYDVLEGLLTPINGIGEFYVYDTALRIGAYRNIFPQQVYIHSYNKPGAEKLGIDPRLKRLDIVKFPDEFWNLPPYEIADILFIYEDVLDDPDDTRLKSKTLKQGSFD